VTVQQKEMETLAATAKRQEVKLKKEMRFIEKFRYKATKAAQVQSRLKQLAKVELVKVPRPPVKYILLFPNRPAAVMK